MNIKSNTRKQVRFKIDENSNQYQEYKYCKKTKLSNNKYYKYIDYDSIYNLIDKFSKMALDK
jgi:hypothetical protein